MGDGMVHSDHHRISTPSTRNILPVKPSTSECPEKTIILYPYFKCHSMTGSHDRWYQHHCPLSDCTGVPLYSRGRRNDLRLVLDLW